MAGHILVLAFLLCFLSTSIGNPHYDSDDALDISSNPLNLLLRDEYNCGKNKPCANGACCGKSGYCGFGAKYCGTSGESPNDACWSNCDAHAECGKDAKKPGTKCPLNVCCSEFGFCGTTDEFCSEGCQSGCKQPGSGASSGNVQQRIIGYYEAFKHDTSCQGMTIKQIPVESLTHVNCTSVALHSLFAFAY